MSNKELPDDRLATQDREGNRIYLYPAEVAGHFRSLRSQLSVILVALFLACPWFQVGGQQALLFDIPRRRFAIFGVTFWAHDVPMLFLVVGVLVLLLAFVTAIWGRVWCGWACPQTVFVDQVFRKIEKWIEGDSVSRRRRDEGPFTFEKFSLKALKWAAFGAVALVISHSLLAYFVGSSELARMLAISPAENPVPFLMMLGITLAILFDFGWFREQFCTLVCPYGRFQSVLMDGDSRVILYDQKRGEPRRGTEGSAPVGDCVNCYRCVQVCPTGIDIRRGVQLECIACTACVDACDEVMRRQKKNPGLIRYASENELSSNAVPAIESQSVSSLFAGASKSQSFWKLFARPRVLINFGLLLLCSIGLAWAIAGRPDIEWTLIRAVDTPYQVIGSGAEAEVINHFKCDLRNQAFDARTLEFKVKLADGLPVASDRIKLVTSNFSSGIESGASQRADLFVQFPKAALSMGKAKMIISLRSTRVGAQDAQGGPSSGPSDAEREVQLVGPFK